MKELKNSYAAVIEKHRLNGVNQGRI